MPTKNPRLNVVVEPELMKFIAMIAKKEDKSKSVVAKELLADAIEKHEDYILSQMAMERETSSRRTVKHKDAWKL